MERGGSSFGNSGTELVDESVGGYRRLSRRRATSNTEQEGSREEKRETNDGEEGGEATRWIERQDRDERRRGRGNEQRRRERERILFLRLYRYFHGRSPLLKPVAVPGPPFPAPSSAPLASYLFVTVSLVSHEPINIFFDVRRIN